MARSKRFSSLLILLCVCLGVSVVRADDVEISGDRITLAAILPALAGTELGEIDLGPAPLPGEARVVLAADVRSALRKSQRDERGLSIPKKVRVVRPERVLAQHEMEERARAALSEVLAPCAVVSLGTMAPETVVAGELTVTAEATVPRSSGRVSAMLKLTQGEWSVTRNVQAVVECPEPVVSAGANVRLIAWIGAVKVSAPGTASQPGRVGDEIRVTNSITRKSLRARVLDAQSAEVIP